MRFLSKAWWPEEVGGFTTDERVSTDSHHSREAAQAVCDALELEGFGCLGKYFPIKTEIVQIDE